MELRNRTRLRYENSDNDSIQQVYYWAIIIAHYLILLRGLAQLDLEHWPTKPGVRGSSPLPPVMRE